MYWDFQNFGICIPFSLARKGDVSVETLRALDSNQIWVDTVEIQFLSSGELYRRGPVWVSDDGELRRSTWLIQGYKGMRDAACLRMDTITIPAEEDSIRVSFRIGGPGVAGADSTEYSFTLYRKEGKKLILDMK
jgi:hypothetical protein